MANFEIAVKKIIGNEGGYVLDAQDPGGETKFGISKRSYPNEDIAALTVERAAEIYRTDFWNKIKGDEIESQEVAESIFDFGVNAGVATSASLAQMVVGSAVDGVIGKNTLASINAFNESHFLAAFTVAKIARYASIVKKRPVSKKYFYGWVLRALEL